MKVLVVAVLLSLAFSLLFFQGAMAGGEVNTISTEFIQGERIFSTDKTVGELSVYGNKAAWTVWNGDGGENPDIYGFVDGSVKQLAASPDPERRASVGNIIAWEKWGKNITIESTAGTIYTQGNPMYPQVDGSNVVFLADDGVYLYNGNSAQKISNIAEYSPDISGNYVVYGPYIYSINNSTQGTFMNSKVSSQISYPWIGIVGRNNFGKSIYISIYNIELGYYRTIWTADTGLYSGLESWDMGDNYMVWTYGGTAYTFNLVTLKLTNYTSSEYIKNMAVGGGKFLWSTIDDSGMNYVYMTNAPSPPDYVDILLVNKNTGVDQEGNHLLISDSHGNKLGYDKNFEHYANIPGGIELSGSGVKVAYRVIGNTQGVKYDVIGNSNGKYDLIIIYHGSQGTSIGFGSNLKNEIYATNMPIKSGEIHRYIVNWQKVMNGGKNAIEVLVDKNGDGNFDLDVFSSSPHITQDILSNSNGNSGNSGDSEDNGYTFDFSMEGSLCYIGILILVLLIVVAIVVRRRKH
jgi:hypothetical protein